MVVDDDSSRGKKYLPAGALEPQAEIYIVKKKWKVFIHVTNLIQSGAPNHQARRHRLVHFMCFVVVEPTHPIAAEQL